MSVFSGRRVVDVLEDLAASNLFAFDIFSAGQALLPFSKLSCHSSIAAELV